MTNTSPSIVQASSAPLRAVYALAERAAKSSTTVLLRGESGVGKEVLARHVHDSSARRDGPFIKVHCAAFPEQILESELFGYERGAFTGAHQRKPGRVELAEGGTLFLDEIGDISPSVQVKLLRILQDKQYERLGGTTTYRANIRYVAATHRNLEEMVRRGQFRQDLYYRLNVVPIHVPPLRERREDIPALVERFIQEFGDDQGRAVRLAPDAADLIRSEPWRGNVRQLRNFVERLVVLSSTSEIPREQVATELEREHGAPVAGSETTEITSFDLASHVNKAERRAVLKALKRSEGDRSAAARLLGISRRTLFYKLRAHDLR